MDTVGENPRGLHATLVLQGRTDFTPDTLNAAAFDSYLPEFARQIPFLIQAYDALATGEALKGRLAGQIELLRHWDYRWSADSLATTLACLWGDALWEEAAKSAKAAKITTYGFIADHMPPAQKLAALQSISERLVQDFGSWRIGWGQINRFQRLNDAIGATFNDAAPSIPVGFASARWGSLASFGARRYEGTKKYYGSSGNTFIAIVEFGDKVVARAVSAGGESGDPTSAHFDDQAARYASGALREVYFYPEQLQGHTERVYHPGLTSFRRAD
jgi:acyl-homoserine-lactone acylase